MDSKEKKKKKKKISSGKLYKRKIFVYVALITLAISIIVPVIWVFMSSLKTNAEFRKSMVITC